VGGGGGSEVGGREVWIGFGEVRSGSCNAKTRAHIQKWREKKRSKKKEKHKQTNKTECICICITYVHKRSAPWLEFQSQNTDVG